jgi:signal transduction histidine kinase
VGSEAWQTRLARVVETADGERRRLERALHDGSQQSLVALTVRLQLAARLVDTDPSGAKELLAELGGDVRAALGELQALGERIYPPLLDAGGLAGALGAPAAGLRRYPRAVEAGVYFCCRDAAGPVRLRDEGDTLTLEIDGVAADAVVGIRDRVDALGGELVVDGGRVRASIPLPP